MENKELPLATSNEQMPSIEYFRRSYISQLREWCDRGGMTPFPLGLAQALESFLSRTTPGTNPKRGSPPFPEVEAAGGGGNSPDVRGAHETCADAFPRWIPIAERVPEPEVFVLCWDGYKTFVEWFGSKPDAGRGVTHWIPYPMPPGAVSNMHDGRRAFAQNG